MKEVWEEKLRNKKKNKKSGKEKEGKFNNFLEMLLDDSDSDVETEEKEV